MKEKAKLRSDGRKNDELRDIEAKIGVIKRADGSALFRIGKTIAYAAVYGPRELHPKFLQNPEKGVLRCNYNMFSFSGSGERIKPGPTRRSREISMVTEKALIPVLNLNQYPNSVIDIFVELLQTDSGTRCAGITAGALALADAGIPMKDLVSSVSIGIVNGHPVVDLTKEEEDIDGTVDIALAATPRRKDITLLQLDGIITKDQLRQALLQGFNACDKIYNIQRAVLKEKYKNE